MDSLTADYRKRTVCFSDFWSAYQAFLPSKRHHAVGNEIGETAHIERLNNTLRQRCSDLVRKTVSFSKTRQLHECRIRLVLDYDNEQIEQHMMLASV